MQHVTQASAWCNGEVAHLAWDMAQPLPDRLPRPQDKECVPPATPSFGRVAVVANKYQTRAEVHGFVVAAI